MNNVSIKLTLMQLNELLATLKACNMPVNTQVDLIALEVLQKTSIKLLKKQLEKQNTNKAFSISMPTFEARSIYCVLKQQQVFNPLLFPLTQLLDQKFNI